MQHLVVYLIPYWHFSFFNSFSVFSASSSYLTNLASSISYPSTSSSVPFQLLINRVCIIYYPGILNFLLLLILLHSIRLFSAFCASTTQECTGVLLHRLAFSVFPSLHSRLVIILMACQVYPGQPGPLDLLQVIFKVTCGGGWCALLLL